MATIDNYIAALESMVKSGDSHEIVEAEKALKDYIMGNCRNSDSPDPDDDQVQNPSHYQSMVGGLDIDCITAMRAAFGDEDVKSFCLLNSFKYLWRSSSKGQNQSIEKGIWYLNKFLELGGYD